MVFKPLDDDDDDDVENGREQSGDFVDECKCLNKVFVFDEEEEEEHSNEDRSRRVILSRERALARGREKARVVCISVSFQVRLCQMNNDVRYFEICFSW